MWPIIKGMKKINEGKEEMNFSYKRITNDIFIGTVPPGGKSW